MKLFKQTSMGTEPTFVGVVVFFWAFVQLCVFIYAADNSWTNKGCTYKNAAQFLSPGYVAGCELFRPRWEVGESSPPPTRN